MISKNIIGVSSLAAAVAVSGLFLAGPASAYNVTADQLTIYKNGNVYINDEFGDGNAPPASGSNFGTGTTPATYSTAGTWTETGGRAVADSTNNPQVIPSAYSSDTINRHNARLNSSSGGNTAIGLRNDDDFYAMALFDLSSVLDKNGSSYNLRFRDSGSGNTINDEARIGVRRTTSGNMIVRYGDFDLDAGTFNILDSDVLLVGDQQILLRLDHLANGNVTGSYAYVSGGLDLTNVAGVAAQSFISMDGAVTLFGEENWTRASLSVTETILVPEPGMAVIFALGFAGFAYRRHRRQI